MDYFANRHHTLSLGLLATLFEFHFVRSFNERTQLDLRQEPVLLEGYVQDEWRLGPTTRVQLGGRGTYFSTGGRWHFTPRLSLSQALSDKVRLKAAGGVYRQHLQLITTEAFSGGDFWVPLDDTVEPGRSYQAVTGVEWTPSPRYLLSVDAYYTDLANLVTVDTELPDDNEGHALRSRVQKRRHRLGQRSSKSFYSGAPVRTHRMDRLRARLDAAHLPRTQ